MTLFLPLFISLKSYLSPPTKRYYFPKGRTPSLDITLYPAQGEHRRTKHKQSEAERKGLLMERRAKRKQGVTKAERHYGNERGTERSIYIPLHGRIVPPLHPHPCASPARLPARFRIHHTRCSRVGEGLTD